MTKLEQKLVELGYLKHTPRSLKYGKFVEGYELLIDTSIKPFKSYIVMEDFWLNKQSEIDELQQAFNEMQKDLEELKEYEEQ